MRIFLLSLGLLSLVAANDFNLARIHKLYAPKQEQASNEILGEQLWYSQVLDHFSPSSSTFQQRYFVNTQYFVPNKGPVLLYVAGEAANSERAVTNGFVVELAKKFGGLIVSLEHRYYGLSQPFAALTTENLRFLSSQQALSDLANFRTFVTRTYKTGTSPWISVGGSYSGNLSAWLRLKFPHLFVASLASSAPVHAKANFFEYDEVVSASAGPKCASLLRNATSRVEEALKSSKTRAEIKKAFDCEHIKDDVEFLYVIADMAAYAIQYKDSVGDKLCEPITQAPDALEAYSAYARWLLRSYLQTDASQFNIAAFTNTSYTEDSNMRQWMYQSCREFGYFQTAPSVNPLRSEKITLDWHYGVCAKLFGQSLLPNVQWTNQYYGSNSTAATNVYFTNGDKDPWKRLGVQRSISKSEPAEVIEGTAHCADLHASSPSDLPSLTQARIHIVESISEWLAGN